MILVFGGTSEGRAAVKVLDEGTESYFYSTRESYQDVAALNAIRISGGLDYDGMIEFCQFRDIKLIIDAAHPFASVLHENIHKVSMNLKIPVIRYERRYPKRDIEGICWCDDFNDASNKLLESGVKKLLALTGVQTVKKLKPVWSAIPTYFRIIDRMESNSLINDENFPQERIIYFKDTGIKEIVKEISPDALITKESGFSGGFMEKVDEALKSGLKVFVVSRPALPDSFINIDGPNGLRREIEKRIPTFFKLRTGFTTGSCATAASKAALEALVNGQLSKDISFEIPEGETMKMEIKNIEISGNSACATVIKDSGDDPDVTDKCEISAKVEFSSDPGIQFIGGEGVGKITLPGLGLSVGEPAINKVPRMMIENNLRKIYDGGLKVTLSVKNGRKLALQTFNPRVGVKDGISIIGTSGIVRPFSHEAFINSIRRQLDVAMEMKCQRIVANSGGKSENILKNLFPDLESYAFIHYGNAIGETLSLAQEKNIKRLTLGIMIGKAVKLAEGNMDTHSHKVTLNKTFLKKMALEINLSSQSLNIIENISLARELIETLPLEEKNKFFTAVINSCLYHCSKLFQGSLQMILISENGEILADVQS